MMNQKEKNKEPEIVKPSPGSLHKGHRARMRRRFEETGFDGWAKHEVLEYMLFSVFRQGNTNDIAHMMLYNCADSFSRLFDIAETEAFQKLEKVGPKTIEYLRTLKAFIDYYHSTVISERAIPFRRESFSEILRLMDFSDNTEDIMVICMSSSLRVKYITSVSDNRGDGFATTKPERILRTATATNSTHVALVHNHPSGDLTPSFDDIYMTKKVDKMLRAVGIFLVDHYIVCGEDIVGIKVILNYQEQQKAKAQVKDK